MGNLPFTKSSLFSYLLHSHIFNWVWVLWCHIKQDLESKVFPHSLHLYFTPVWFNENLIFDWFPILVIWMWLLPTVNFHIYLEPIKNEYEKQAFGGGVYLPGNTDCNYMCFKKIIFVLQATFWGSVPVRTLTWWKRLRKARRLPLSIPTNYTAEIPTQFWRQTPRLKPLQSMKRLQPSGTPDQ